jgi:hypothetical protein
MAQCSQCKAETRLHSMGVPICVSCDDALLKKQEAREAKRGVTGEDPDGGVCARSQDA